MPLNPDVDEREIATLYVDERMSITDIADNTGIPPSTVRNRLLRHGVRLRGRAAARAEAFERKPNPCKGRSRPAFSDTWCKNISDGRRQWASQNAAGVSAKTGGYVEYTRGPNKGRSVHVVTMEKRLGRKLKPDEVVHHIDGDKHNNNENNLALMTRGGHSRHHRLIEGIKKCREV